MSKKGASVFGLTACFALASCSLAPDYQRPEVVVPDNYKEAGDWLPATPEYADHDTGPWWKAYHDEDMDALEDKVTNANQDLKAAVARWDDDRDGSVH